jgi:hypothetical protein
MKVEFDVQPEEKITYGDIRTGKCFTWWTTEKINPDAIYLKGEEGYVRLTTGDIIPHPVIRHGARVFRVDAKLVITSIG